jgi:phage shock protein C
MKRLVRKKLDRKISGLCAGIGEYFDIDPNLIRLGWLILTITTAGTGLFAYLIGSVIVPEEGGPNA